MRQVVFKNCMGHCNVTNKELPNFNKQFYYSRPDLQNCLQDCYNTRVELHLGAENAKAHDMLIDFAEMKREYQDYEKWAPSNKFYN